MTLYESLVALPPNPKFIRLQRALRIPEYQALGILLQLWIFTAQHAWLSGNIGKYDDDQIAAIFRVGEAHGAMILQTLINEGWIDANDQDTGPGRLVVHNWRLYNDCCYMTQDQINAEEEANR